MKLNSYMIYVAGFATAVCIGIADYSYREYAAAQLLADCKAAHTRLAASRLCMNGKVPFCITTMEDILKTADDLQFITGQCAK